VLQVPPKKMKQTKQTLRMFQKQPPNREHIKHHRSALEQRRCSSLWAVVVQHAHYD